MGSVSTSFSKFYECLVAQKIEESNAKVCHLGRVELQKIEERNSPNFYLVIDFLLVQILCSSFVLCLCSQNLP